MYIHIYIHIHTHAHTYESMRTHAHTSVLTNTALAGHHCSQGSVYPVPCNPGHASKPGQPNCSSCPNGTYAPEFGMPECMVCPPGHMCPMNGTAVAQVIYAHMHVCVFACTYMSVYVYIYTHIHTYNARFYYGRMHGMPSWAYYAFVCICVYEREYVCAACVFMQVSIHSRMRPVKNTAVPQGQIDICMSACMNTYIHTHTHMHAPSRRYARPAHSLNQALLCAKRADSARIHRLVPMCV